MTNEAAARAAPARQDLHGLITASELTAARTARAAAAARAAIAAVSRTPGNPPAVAALNRAANALETLGGQLSEEAAGLTAAAGALDRAAVFDEMTVLLRPADPAPARLHLVRDTG